jgi:hypothetical protein
MMQNIYKEIEAIFDEEFDQKPPAWANEMMNDIKEIKTLLQTQNQQQIKIQSQLNTQHQTIKRIDQNFYNFIKEFRKNMKANVDRNIYPTLHYNNKRYGINFKGLIYDKEDLHILPKSEAFKIYEFAYEKRNYLDIYTS